MPTLAVFGDLHLSDTRGTAQDAALQWARGRLWEREPDAVVVVGDVTTAGTEAATRWFRSHWDTLPGKRLVALGNTDARTPAERERMQQFLASEPAMWVGGWHLTVVDTGRGSIPGDERRRLEELLADGGRLLVFMHHPPASLDSESRAWWDAWAARAQPELVVAGHVHYDSSERLAWGGALHTLRGLDPDKAMGGPPAVAWFTAEADGWRRQDEVFSAASGAHWSVAERKTFLGQLGISCFAPLECLDFALERGIRQLELRNNLEAIPLATLRDRLERWRESGGRWLSLHMPEFPWDAAADSVGDVSVWEAYLHRAKELGVDALTIHVPNVPVEAMPPGGRTWQVLADRLTESVQNAGLTRVTVGVENMHMREGEPADERRRFGYRPDECAAWMEALRERLPENRVGCLLDVGHARNNAPFSAEYPLGTWYAMVGGEAVGYHLHQVRLEAGAFRNHQPIEDIYGPLISFSSFLWAWDQGQLHAAPLILELRSLEAYEQSLAALARLAAGDRRLNDNR